MTSWTRCLTTSCTGIGVGWASVAVMSDSLSPRTRASIINYDPTQPHALSVTEFCRSLKISRSVFYKV